MTALRAAALAMCAAGGLSAAELTFEQWRADLDYLGRELPRRHRNLFHTLSRAEFERRLKELSSAVPKLSDLEVRAGIARLVAAAADGHTGAELAAERVFDFSFLEFADGLYVIGASKVNAEAVGARVISIDGMPTLEVRRRLGEFLAMENQYSAAQYVALIPKTVYLRAAGIIHSTDGAEFVLEKDGSTFSVRAATRGVKDPPAERAKSMAVRPLYLKDADQFYWVGVPG